MILKCSCEHSQQDKLHGKNQRVHNESKAVPPKYKCTVCGSERDK